MKKQNLIIIVEMKFTSKQMSLYKSRPDLEIKRKIGSKGIRES